MSHSIFIHLSQNLYYKPVHAVDPGDKNTILYMFYILKWFHFGFLRITLTSHKQLSYHKNTILAKTLI